MGWIRKRSNVLDRVEVFVGGGGQSSLLWYWRAYSTNGRIVADGGEGYINRGDAEKMVKALFPGVPIR